MERQTRFHEETAACARAVVERLGGRIVMGLPLGLGKPNAFANAIYALACADPAIRLEIFTALSLDPPRGRPGLERRFLEPLGERLFAGYPRLAYVRDRQAGRLPANVRVTEFYFAPGQLLGVDAAQQAYCSSNYTHVARDLLDRGLNLLAQAVAVHEAPGAPRRYSLGSNPDLTLDLLDARARGAEFIFVAAVNPRMPFMPGDAERGIEAFDELLDAPDGAVPMFPVLNRPLRPADYAAGLHASSLVADGGTLQVGIGSMGDAVVHALMRRHQDNAAYRRLLDDLAGPRQQALRAALPLEREPFRKGLFGNSEMLVHGFAGLRAAGVLTRRVYDHAGLQRAVDALDGDDRVGSELVAGLIRAGVIGARLDADAVALLRRFGLLEAGVEHVGGQLDLGNGTAVDADLARPGALERLAGFRRGQRLTGGHFLEAAFFLGPNALYRWLEELPDEERAGVRMTRVSRVNQLYGDEPLRRAQRVRARFINEAMMVTLLGAVVSDALADGQVVSGVGGQYNFVAMAHELEDARAVIMLPATRCKAGKLRSNIVWNYAHATLPRHLRDIVVTEYGAADLRGKSDRDVIAALLCIADSRFQGQLVAAAQAAGKIERDYAVPEDFRANLPERLDAILLRGGRGAQLPHFPFGSDLSDVEARLALALGLLGRRLGGARGLVRLLREGRAAERREGFAAELRRVGLDHPRGLRQRLERRLLRAALTLALADGRPLRGN